MDTIQLMRPEGLLRSPAFSQVAVVPPGASLVLVGGQNAVDETGALVGGDDVAAQTTRVMANLAAALDAAGVGIEHLVSVSVLLVDAALVPGLGVPGALVEVSAVAAVVR
jgi:enamine deaminase RidA (YjgF/YER057c/UK114 family)